MEICKSWWSYREIRKSQKIKTCREFMVDQSSTTKWASQIMIEAPWTHKFIIYIAIHLIVYGLPLTLKFGCIIILFRLRKHTFSHGIGDLCGKPSPHEDTRRQQSGKMKIMRIKAAATYEGWGIHIQKKLRNIPLIRVWEFGLFFCQKSLDLRLFKFYVFTCWASHWAMFITCFCLIYGLEVVLKY